MTDLSEHIKFVKEKGTNKRAYFQCGSETVPASLITRLATDLDDKPDRFKERQFTTKLNMPRPGKQSYAKFLDELDAADIDYLDAFNHMCKSSPTRKIPKTRIDRIITAITKLLHVKKTDKTVEERYDIFLDNVNNPDFRQKVVKGINELESKIISIVEHVQLENATASSKKSNVKPVKKGTLKSPPLPKKTK